MCATVKERRSRRDPPPHDSDHATGKNFPLFERREGEVYESIDPD
jgi:hypothetical protein